MNLIFVIFAHVLVGFVVGHGAIRIASRSFFGNKNSKYWNGLAKLFAALCLAFFYVKENFKVKNYDSSTIAPTSAVYKLFDLIALLISVFVGECLAPVALTGSIATGKSTSVKMLKDCAIVDLDLISHDILLSSPRVQGVSIYEKVVKEFGSDIIEDGGDEIDRTKLGAKVFSSAEWRHKLNKMIHPVVFKCMMRQIWKGCWTTKYCIVDIPLLYESRNKFLRMLFLVEIVVACEPELQLKRLQKRNPELTLQQCRDRISSQVPVEEKVRLADVVIFNNGGEEDLHREVKRAQQEMHDRIYGILPRISMQVALWISAIWLSTLL